jgi:uncharacterized PurR-regulated membrane protein YhhQ (DUF165 family)
VRLSRAPPSENSTQHLTPANMQRFPILAGYVAAMVTVIVAANITVQKPINDWLTWGALTYPFAFLVTDLANRFEGPAFARKVVYAGFVIAIGASAWLATPRIAIASGLAFLTAELLDIVIFDKLRRLAWWKPPLVSTLAASVVDTAVFFSVAFAGTQVPWVTLGIGDLGVKVLLAVLALVPFRAAMALYGART